MAKPITPLAKADAAITRDHRRTNPKFDHDLDAFGQRVADYNAGWLRGFAKAQKSAGKPTRGNRRKGSRR
jgi:hypothetical protein